MPKHSSPECDRLLHVLTGECTEKERVRFQRHMSRCPSCRRQWNEFREVWEELPMDMEDVPVPGDLKNEVMDAIFVNQADETAARPRPVWMRPSLFFSVSAAAFLFLACSVWEWQQIHFHPSAGKANELQIPMNVAAEYPLYAFSPEMPDVRGTISLVDQGRDKLLIVAISGLKQTVNSEAYQLWMLEPGERYNCGTFRVNRDGRGTLTYHLSDPKLNIAGFGITLEPDPHGDSPRGVKVAGTRPT